MGSGGKIRGSVVVRKVKANPKCLLPRSKAYALGKKGRASAARRKRKKIQSQIDVAKQQMLPKKECIHIRYNFPKYNILTRGGCVLNFVANIPYTKCCPKEYLHDPKRGPCVTS